MKNFKLTLKNLLFILFFSFTINITAQTVNTSVASDVNTVLSLLEKNRIPHNILIDYGFDFIDITQYDGVLQTNNYMTIGNYKEIYNTLVSSATASGISGIASPMQEQAEWRTLQQQENNTNKTTNTASIVLNGLLYNYSKINSNALNNNKINILFGKYDDKYINGVWQNPYDTHIAFAMASPAILISKANVSVSLPATLWHSNATISNIDIDFGNGTGYKTLNNEATAFTTYTAIGDYTWTYRVQLTNGQYKYCRQKVHISEADKGAQARNSSCSIQPVVITATRSYLGVFGSATVQIAYGSSDCTLRKPLIVAEGLDTGFFARTGSIGDSDINLFLASVVKSTSPELRDLITNNTAIDYDVVYVNWDNGTDYLQRNAYVLQAVIDYVNANKTGSEPNLVLGQSMGGVIARYALRDMENRSESHDTSLYISHDAPHQGAHIPLGLLYMARHAVDQFIETPLGDFNIPVNETGNVTLGSVGDLLDAPGVQQMLINNVNSNLQVDNTMHDTWQNELRLMGYPQQTRNIALSNASHCAETQGLFSNEELMNITFDGNTSGLTDLILFATGAGALVGDFFNDTLTFILGFLPGNTKLEADFNVNAYPSSGTAQIYRGKLIYEKTLLWVLPIRRTITDRSFNSPSGVLFYDNYPGGINPTGIEFVGSGYLDSFIGNYQYNISFNSNFNFISAPSALDVGNNNTALLESDYLKAYNAINPPTGSKAIPFDNFTTSYNTSSINEPHISFNRLNGDWLATELDDVANNSEIFDCSFVCDGSTATITGGNTLCNSNVYSVNVGSGAVVNWSVSNTSAASLSSPTGASVTVTTPTNSYRTNITLTAIISSSKCGSSITLTKNIRIGKPDTPSSINGPALVNTGALVSYRAGVSTGATSYAWYLPYPYTTVSTFDYSGLNWQLQAPGNTAIAQTFTGFAKNAGYVQVMGENACGKGGAKLLYVQHQSSGGGGGPGGGGIASVGSTDNVKEVSLCPNPAKNKVTVSLTRLTEYEGEPPTVIYGIKIMDLSLIERKFYQFRKFKNQETINVGFLETGLYSLIVYTDTATFTKMLLIL
jgi:hypothetical protein